VLHPSFFAPICRVALRVGAHHRLLFGSLIPFVAASFTDVLYHTCILWAHDINTIWFLTLESSEVFEILVEGVITFIIVAALFYVAPGVLGAIKTAAPVVLESTDAGLNASQTQISTTVSGGLNLSSISMIMLGIGIMIGGFMLVRGYRQ